MTRKYYLLGWLILVVFSACNNDQGNLSTDVVNNPNTASGEVKDNLPVIEFEKEMHDFGKVIQGEKVSYGFKFINTDPSLIAKHPTQIYEALAYLGIFIFLWMVYLRNNGKPRPGFIFGMFMILVFSFRFIIEFVKEPQVSFEVGMALNMGQLLSIPFILLGVGTLVYSYRKTDKKTEQSKT